MIGNNFGPQFSLPTSIGINSQSGVFNWYANSSGDLHVDFLFDEGQPTSFNGQFYMEFGTLSKYWFDNTGLHMGGVTVIDHNGNFPTLPGGSSVQLLSPIGGNNGETDYLTATPAFQGQLGVAYYGDIRPFLYSGNSASAGDWLYAFNFPTGIHQIGSVADMDPNNCQNTSLIFAGSASAYNTAGDFGPIVYNYSTNSSATTAYSIAVMSGTTGAATVVDPVGVQFAHSTRQRISALMNGWAMVVCNSNTNVRGFAIAAPGTAAAGPGPWGPGSDTGNFSGLLVDYLNGLVRIPKWVAGAYQPSDAGWTDTLTVNPVTQVTNFYGEIRQNQTNGKFTMPAPGIAIHGYGSNGGTMAFCDSGYTADFCLISANLGLQFQNIGQGLTIKEGANARSGTAVLNGTTAVVVGNTSITENTRILLTTNVPGGTVGTPYVSATVNGTSFSIKSTNAADTSTVAYMLFEKS